MSTIRHQIVSSLVVRLKTITVANGYNSDAGLTVYSWHPENRQVETLPMLVVNDLADTLSDSGRDQLQHTLRVEITGMMRGGATTTIVMLRALIGDIAKVVMDPEDRTLGGVCDTMQFVDGGAIQLEQTTEEVVGSVALTLMISFVTDRGDWSVKI